MTRRVINAGSPPNLQDDSPLDDWQRVERNFQELYSGVGSALPSVSSVYDSATAALAAGALASTIIGNVGVIFIRPSGQNVVATQTTFTMTQGGTTYSQVVSYNSNGDVLEITPWQ
jgi:hypothetical protein